MLYTSDNQQPNLIVPQVIAFTYERKPFRYSIFDRHFALPLTVLRTAATLVGSGSTRPGPSKVDACPSRTVPGATLQPWNSALLRRA